MLVIRTVKSVPMPRMSLDRTLRDQFSERSFIMPPHSQPAEKILVYTETGAEKLLPGRLG